MNQIIGNSAAKYDQTVFAPLAAAAAADHSRGTTQKPYLLVGKTEFLIIITEGMEKAAFRSSIHVFPHKRVSNCDHIKC